MRKFHEKTRNLKKKAKRLRKFIKKDYSFKTNCFREMGYLFLAKFHFFAKNAKFGEKICEIRQKFFIFFRRTFPSLETLIIAKNK